LIANAPTKGNVNQLSNCARSTSVNINSAFGRPVLATH
jgi:hypothetical protein